MVRRRLGELGLTFQVVTVPRAREERKAVYEVSGQYLVPTLVLESEDGRQVLVDENDILAELARRYGPPPDPPAAGPLAPQDQQTLAALAGDCERLAASVRELWAKAQAAGRTDPANVLCVAADNLAEAARWLARQVENLA